MIETAKLTINLTPELWDYLFHASEQKQVSPDKLATDILQGCLREEAGRADASGPQPRERRLGQPLSDPIDIAADIQRTLEALGDELPGFSSDDPLAAEVEAIISQVEAERKND